MVKDEDVCVHCGLCAERCPTAAWDMRTFELVLPYAGQPVEAPRLHHISKRPAVLAATAVLPSPAFDQPRAQR
jgi:ferredoxin